MAQDDSTHSSSRNHNRNDDNSSRRSETYSTNARDLDRHRTHGRDSNDRREPPEDRPRRDRSRDGDYARGSKGKRRDDGREQSRWQERSARRRRSRSRSGSRRSVSPRRSFRDEPKDRRGARDRDRDRERDETYGRSSHRSYRSRSRSPRSAPPSGPDSRRREDSTRPSRSRSRSRSPGSRSSKPPEDKSKPNFKPSGLLAAETNAVKRSDGTTTVLKYNEPPEARRPNVGWRLYVFKGQDQTDMMHVHRQSCYLIGRDRMVADIPLEHPSCSKQHAVIQHRQVQQKDEFGAIKSAVKPFIIDLESTNGTHVNDEQIPTSRYYELRAGDVIKFGLSNREYVIMHDEA